MKIYVLLSLSCVSYFSFIRKEIVSFETKIIRSGIFKSSKIIQRNAFLKSTNTIDTNVYFVKKGSLKIVRYCEKEEQIIRFGYDGNLLVSLDSFINESLSELAIQAIKKTEVLVATKEDFISFVYGNLDNTKAYISLLEQLLLQQLERETYLLLDTPQARFETVFKQNPQLFQWIPDKHIANYLRMTPETLSRLKKS